MKHLLNILAGVGSAMNAFGTLPQYDVPKRGDRARDLALIRKDFGVVTGRIETHASKALAGKYGTTHDGAGKK
ncbi:hypothetical protein HDG34_005897 [Paraburkholderia sp. HC6.4b]|uniref:hypothetical protein n=1 Tax=unclassified Paraburkholderia TaxID=2615204 RepID=UPI001615C489|nr:MULTISPECIES: hypothetical protein [unclassified Paraburkholderia]MBB5411931.1 hypothetical protein [Paraburkholderia sp. HC6.4b]MBB5450243.1 hypothetical protein [Paraburkholderia sp. Kb1A]